MTSRAVKRFTLVALLTSLLAGAAMVYRTDRVEATAASKLSISYTYSGSTVPPQYRRDIDLDITGDAMTIRVTSYGKLVASFNMVVPPGVLAQVQQRIGSLKNIKKAMPKGCTGGVANELKMTSNSVNIKRVVKRCGATNGGEFDKTEAAVEPLLALLGDRDTAFRIGEEP